jgi:hypothetical protein
MAEICGDNRFELIEKYKTKLIEATNIETAKDEMAVIDSILFRFWQMGWLDKLEADVVPRSEVEKWFRECEVLQGRFIELEKEVARDFDDLKRYIILNENIAIKCKRENGEQNEEYWKGKISAFKQIRAYIDAELKKKYTESEDKP